MNLDQIQKWFHRLLDLNDEGVLTDRQVDEIMIRCIDVNSMP